MSSLLPVWTVALVVPARQLRRAWLKVSVQRPTRTHTTLSGCSVFEDSFIQGSEPAHGGDHPAPPRGGTSTPPSSEIWSSPATTG
eukprot:1832964-Pleurochrysis_carterae.AAC.1